MSPRSIRRAMERKAMKEARKTAKLTSDRSSLTPHLATDHNSPITERNRQNAQFSTGPITPEGKAKSSLNAVKTGLTGRTVLLPTDDAEAYAQHVQRFHARYQPVGEEESALVQSLADTEWRLMRIPSLEAGIYALGRIELADLYPDQDEAVRKQLIEAKIFITYQRQLNNLSIQENRLRRQREKDLAKLQELQALRRQAALAADHSPLATDLAPEQPGFVFSTQPQSLPSGFSASDSFLLSSDPIPSL